MEISRLICSIMIHIILYVWKSITWKVLWIFLVWHYYIEIVNTADKFSSIKNSSTFLIA